MTIASVVRLLDTAFWYCGNATAAKIPMIKTTTNNSISVNPAFFPAGWVFWPRPRGRLIRCLSHYGTMCWGLVYAKGEPGQGLGRHSFLASEKRSLPFTPLVTKKRRLLLQAADFSNKPLFQMRYYRTGKFIRCGGSAQIKRQRCSFPEHAHQGVFHPLGTICLAQVAQHQTRT